ncbi:DUF6412 domain-containing protein [Streptomyces sp. IBSBF 2806]|uniref:DUF6412 domain-containing protein n=1 Tax=Streptomyces sp. IBSBF 2806 TaxID=2903529 RepID=UPI002FDB9C86
MTRSAPHRVLRSISPAALLLLLVTDVLLLDSGGLSAVSAAFALAATAAAGSALAVCALVAARSAPAVPPTRVRTAIRDRARRTGFLPQRDPDASGRPRPRAPGHALPTTVA